MSVKESYIEAELYRYLKNLIDLKPNFNRVTFVDVKDRMRVSNGEADIVIFGEHSSEPFSIVIETKRKTNQYNERFDPYSVSVIGQALGYAASLDSRFIATTNGDIFVIFDVNRKGNILQKQVGKSLKVKMNQEFAALILNNISLYLEGRLEQIELGDAFIDRLRYFHSLISPIVYDLLEKERSNNNLFEVEYTEWLIEQGLKSTSDTEHNIAAQAAYLIMNRIMFYKTLESFQSNLNLLPLKGQNISNFDPELLLNRINECFDYVVSSIDYEAVFTRSQIFDRIPYSKLLLSYLNDFIMDIEQYNLTEINRDIIGEVYQKLIPLDERRKLGQYYTPTQVTELITQFCVRSKDTTVLDPSCGSGGFLVSAYERLKSLNEADSPEKELHNKILSQVYGVDINQFAAHLSVINLTMRDLSSSSDKINVLSTDFFQIPQLQAQIGREHEEATLSASESKRYLPLGRFDAIIANPPYTRQDEIGNKEYINSVRENALTFFEKRFRKKRGTFYVSKKYEMSTETGIYSYFLFHSTHFLKENGHMGFIIYNSWLQVKFGKYLQRFLLDNFKIIALVDFNNRVFSDASVNTVIVLLQKLSKKEDSNKRDTNLTKFVTVKKPISTGQLISMIENKNNDFDSDLSRIVSIPQSQLRKETKWGHYLKAPPLYYTISSKLSTKLKDVAKISVGYVTLSNDFFVLNKPQAESLGIEHDFLKPLILNTREVRYLDISMEDCAKYLFLVNEEVKGVKGTFAEDYIRVAESRDVEITRGHEKGKVVVGYQNLPALKNKKTWFELPIREPPKIIVPVLIWDRWFAVLNKNGIYTTQNFYWINPLEEVHLYPLLAVLNSTVTEFFVEILGKSGYGDGVIELMKHNFEEIPTVDFKTLSEAQLERLTNLYIKLAECSRKSGDMGPIRKNIDLEIFKASGLDTDKLHIMYTDLKNLRDSRKRKVKTSIMLK